MRVTFSTRAWDDYLWFAAQDRVVLKRIHKVIEDIRRGDPYEGIGKPEPLSHELSGWWSRRITDEHRLVHRTDDDVLEILQVRYHYRR